MDKIKKMDEFENIFEYFCYLKNTLDDLNQKKSRAVSVDSKKFYQEQIDYVMKHRSSIRDVVLAKKEQIIHEKLSNIKDEQIKKFINAKKKEKERISHEKINLELEIALQTSISDLDKNFFAPIAKYANEYECSDFFVTDENYNKSYLIKNNNNELEEVTGVNILSNYLGNNVNLIDKINKRHELKNNFMNQYIEELKLEYPNYAESKIKKLAHDNLVSHSPEFSEKLEKEYGFSNEEYEQLAKAYSDFKADYQYLTNEDLNKKQEKLDKLEKEFNSISKIPDGKDLEEYLLKKFQDSEKKTKLIKSFTEILENDSNIAKYINKNNLLTGIELSPETKLEYIAKLEVQNSLLEEVKKLEQEMQNHTQKLQEYEEHLTKLKHSKSALGDIYTKENIINNVEDIVEEYNNKFVLPLKNAQEEYNQYKNSQELGLVPYQKIGFFEKIAGFFNGRNKIQAEFNTKCQEYESKIYVLTQKSRMHKPNYSFDDKHSLAKEIGESIKDYLSKHADSDDLEASKAVLETYRNSLNGDIASFKENYRDYISNLDECSSYSDISDCVLEEINKVQKQLEKEKLCDNNINFKKNSVCNEYNENAKMPISAVSTLEYLDNVSKEYETQFQKLSSYKGENLETLKYKIEVEKALETDNSFISSEEISELISSAHKKAELILNNAINSLGNEQKKKELDVQPDKFNRVNAPKKLVMNEIAL